MHNFNNFLLISESLVSGNNLIKIDEGLASNYLPVFYNDHFCYYHGIIHNSDELFILAGSKPDTIEAVLIVLFIRDPEKFPSLLKGYFSLVIGNKEILYLLRDGNGYENLYLYDNQIDIDKIIISNSIKEIAVYYKLEVNTGILPEYFLKTDINSGATFFKNIRTLSFFEFVRIDRQTQTNTKDFFDNFFSLSKSDREINVNVAIKECNDLIGSIINEKYDQLCNQFTLVNALSGGTDSSFIQYFLKKRNSDIAYTANFIKAGLDHTYASDVARILTLNQRTVHSDTGDLIDSMPLGIFLSEKPFLFAGESLLFNMYRVIGKEQKVAVACFDGTGAEGIFGASRILYELRIIRKYRFFSGLILPLFKLRSEKLYMRYKEFHKYVNTGTIPDNFILRYFTDEKIRDTIKGAFNLNDLNHIDDYEVSMMKKYNTILFEAVYRFLAFELEYKRVNNTRLQLAKNYNISLVFPFTETSLFKYLIRIDTELKLWNAKTKYLFRKAMARHFPKSIVYRKKIKKNVSVSDEILENEKVKKIIEEIKIRRYSYFNFNYDEIFGSSKYAAVAYKLINFHIWHKLFIDRERLSELEEK